MEQSKEKKSVGKNKKRQPDNLSNERTSSKIFNLILKYKDSKFFKWISEHHTLAIVLVAMWGLLIVIFTLWFIISNIMRGNLGNP
jgi:hypothetical protein